MAPTRSPRTLDPRGEFPFDVTTYCFHLFAVLSRHREALMDQAFRPLGLNVARYRALSVVVRLAPIGMSELADYSAVDRTTMTRTVDQLVGGGLVERATPPSDRRQVRLTPTEAGLAANREALRVVYRLNRRALEALDEEIQRQICRAQQTMIASLVDDPSLVRRLLALDEGR